MKKRLSASIARKAVATVASAALALSMMPAAALAYAAESGDGAGGGARLAALSVGDSLMVPDAAPAEESAEGVLALVYTATDDAVEIVGSMRLDAEAQQALEPGDPLPDSLAPAGALSAQGEGTGGGAEYVYYSDSAESPDTRVVVPATIGGKAVTAIGDEAFQDSNWIEEVVLPDTIVRIGSYAFAGCEKLESINLPSSLERIGYEAFYSCKALTAVSIPSGCSLGSYAFSSCSRLATLELAEGATCTTWYEEDGSDPYTEVSEYVFSSCSSLKSVKIPASMNAVGYGMFRYCNSLESIELAEGVASVGSWAFYGCRPVSTVVLPASLKDIGEKAFYWDNEGYWDDDDNYIPTKTYTIQTATIDQYWKLVGNGRYIMAENTTVLKPEGSTEGELVFETENVEDGTLRIVGLASGSGYPAALKIPATIDSVAVSAVADSAFEDAGWIESLAIEEGVKTVENEAFRGCAALTSVSVPSGCWLGDEAFADCSALTDVALADGVTCSREERYQYGYVFDEGMQDYVPSYKTETRESSSVFRNCDALETVALPGSLATVCESMFNDCNALKTVTVGEGVTAIGSSAFYYCYALENVSLPEGLAEVGDYAFAYCGKLSNVQIPSTVTSIGTSAFEDCSLSTITLPESLERVDYGAFRYCSPTNAVVLPVTLTSIGENAFRFSSEEYWDEEADDWVTTADSFTINAATWQQYWKLQSNGRYIDPKTTTVSKPSGVEEAFALKTEVDEVNQTVAIVGATGSQASVVIPDKVDGMPVTAIDRRAFEDATWMKSITLPSTISSIGPQAFQGCAALEGISVPAGCKLGAWAFADCSALASVTLPEGVSCASVERNAREVWNETTEENETTYDPFISESVNVFENCDALETITLPGSLATVCESMFYNCDALKTVTVGEGITAIDSSAFEDCYALESVNLPEGLAEIGYDAFSYCSKLSNVQIPSTVTSIGSRAFYNCRVSAVSLPASLEGVGSHAFDGCSPASIVVLPATLTSIGEGAFSFNDEYWDEEADGWVSNKFTIQTSTWAQFWKLRENSRYINTSSTTVLTPTGNTRERIMFTYTLNPDGTVTITGAKSKVANLVIPSYITGDGYAASASGSLAGQSAGLGTQDAAATYKVTTIGTDAFKGNRVVQSVVIPETVTSIESGAFASCNALVQAIVPASVTSIGDDAFQDSGSEDAALTIVCDENSFAAQYAEEKNIARSSTIDLSKAGVATCAPASVSYSPKGTARPKVVVTVGETTLVEGKDYTVSFGSGADAVGTVMVTVAATGERYTGETWCSYVVERANIKDAMVNMVASQVYTGQALYPKPSVTFRGVELQAGTDYTLAYRNNIAVGTATVVITGVGNYTGERLASFTIEPSPVAKPVSSSKPGKATTSTTRAMSTGSTPAKVSLAKATVTLAKKKFTYTGKTIKPAVKSVKVNGKVVPASGYSISYKNNKKAGKASLTIKGKGAYTGSKTVKFTISKAKQAVKVAKKSAKKTYKAKKLKKKGATFKIGAKATGKGKLSYKLDKKAKASKKIAVSKKGKVTLKKGLAKGTYKIKVKAAATKNYKAASKTIVIKVK